MEEKISFEQAKKCFESYKKRKRLKVFGIVSFIAFFASMFIAGVVCSAIELLGLGVAFIFIPIIAMFVGYYFYSKLPMYYSDEEIVEKYLIQTFKERLLEHKFKTNLVEVEEDPSKINRYISIFLSKYGQHRMYGQKSLESSLIWPSIYLQFQQFLDRESPDFNKQYKRTSLEQQIDKFVERIKDDYYPDEFELISSRAREYKISMIFSSNLNYTFLNAKNFICFNGIKTIPTKISLDSLRETREKILKDPSEYAITKFNNDLKMYYSPNIKDLEIPQPPERKSNERYISYCWRCGHDINEDKLYSPKLCSKCGRYHCRNCGACHCDFGK